MMHSQVISSHDSAAVDRPKILEAAASEVVVCLFVCLLLFFSSDFSSKEGASQSDSPGDSSDFEGWQVHHRERNCC